MAVKVLSRDCSLDTETVRQFERSAKAAAGLAAHPNIASVFYVGRDGNLHFAVTELVVGSTLQAAIAAKPFSVDRACHLAAEVASALEFAHRHGLVHGDIKPQNILLAADGTVKVTDFGMDFTYSAHQAGNSGYASPEQIRGKPASALSDVYSLGMVLYEMLAGELPFGSGSAPAPAAKPHQEGAPQLGPARSQIPAEVDAIVLRATSKKPRQRYPSATAFREALQGRFGHDLGRERRFEPRPSTARHPLLAALALALLLGVFGVTAFIMYGKLATHTAVPAIPTKTPTKTPAKKVPPASHPSSHPTAHPAPTPRPKPSPVPVIARGVGLTYIFIDPAFVRPGGLISLRYTVVNASHGRVPVNLSATIIRSRNGLAFSDPTHEVVVTSVPGIHRYTRLFEVPPTAPGGAYDLLVSVNTPTLSHSYAKIRLRRLVRVAGSSTG